MRTWMITLTTFGLLALSACGTTPAKSDAPPADAPPSAPPADAPPPAETPPADAPPATP